MSKMLKIKFGLQHRRVRGNAYLILLPELQWLMPILQRRSVLNEMKKCDTLLLNRYNFTEFHVARTNK
ncbi:hypothetical protein FH5T_13850 [Draconibacterium orientale]|uniref:Uncharacterized protein n=1 Tax=Draconibacterium orientale TaxID=1168034 RepID=A0ABM5QEB5_9BACT|nr:hypothetical protein FH5T_13850 [Draconibacterium orientale]